MKLQIREFAAFVGVSVRTLHYYDQIGLLPPASVDKLTGYRYYDENSLLRMQEILFYRELDFPLKHIREILSSPQYDKTTALQQQKRLLTLKKERLERLIAAIDSAGKGENIMNVFDNSEFETYKAEAKARWGNTAAYQEQSEKTQNYSRETWGSLQQEMWDIFAGFSACMADGSAPESEPAQEQVKKLQEHITANYYRCSREILAGLGQMYVADERFRANIDRSGEGTAEYAARAIAHYCK